MQDKHFHSIIDMLEPGDALVMNDTRVLPARLYGQKWRQEVMWNFSSLRTLVETSGKFWLNLPNASRSVLVSALVMAASALSLQKNWPTGTHCPLWIPRNFPRSLGKSGRNASATLYPRKLDDRERYQTVYAKESGSAAAPTAGLHFTKELLAEIQAKGVHLVYLTLHVGLGTFRPVSVDNLDEHEMHSEFYQLSEEAAATLRSVKENGGRVIAVGTTSIRTLETIGSKFDGQIQADSGWTNIFIKPGYEWKVVDAFSTNFHLPKSTLVMLVSAFAGRELVLDAYHHAIQEHYRFFSFGDAMFIYWERISLILLIPINR